MLKLFRYFKKKDVGLVLISICFTALCVYADLTIPDYMSDITRLIETSGTEMSDILSIGGKMLAYALLSMASSIVVCICASTLSSDFSARLRDMLFKKVQSFSMNEIGHFSTSSLITRSTNDVTQIQMFIVLGLQMLIRAPIMAVWAVFKIVGQAWQWTLATGITIVLVLAAVIIILQFAVPKFKIMQKLTDRLNTVTRENLTGLRVVRAYNAEGYQENKFEKANADLTDANLYAQHAMAFLMPSIMSSINGLTLVIYWIGASVIESAALGSKITLFSDMVVFSQYAIQAIMSFLMLVMIFMILPRASVAAQRINEVLDTPLTIQNGTEKDGMADKEGEIVFDHVSFRYPGGQDDVLHDISFTAKKGTTTAIIGATGSGKSTLINLIPRFYDTSEGSVTVDGRNVRDYDECALRNRIGYISQSAILFTGTVSSNVGFGDNGRQPATEEEIKDAVETAQASEFVEKMDGTYDAYIAQLGGNLSGGQKQRLSIARAIARKPEILIFDDSFSALDYKTDSILRKELDEKCSDTTRIIVAQRIGTIRNADQILVLEDGKLAGMGTHEELMKNCTVYQQIALSQLSKEELA
ncbi:MAG: ABC transporter ATP-binding protein/permease [Solobacterium sp.]|jgi:ATP-binding cassette subfamily B protein|nr:ABC transporter ATP-binding protein/permease [Solobacterium sp.]MCH4049040.1 ABC transporter ATP-binding protein/permease [Solobacterium sp.]MCH4074206.1 ABC transporter ATP-binding protein/permease [Solobacterium sp.]MCI1313807.1 ABC transporter ATP-binding protein/permease [Solobacterium sp.]MCI1345953.1 ABC transporter ATP-binding protein/permease [Solobacterium sp.]